MILQFEELDHIEQVMQIRLEIAVELNESRECFGIGGAKQLIQIFRKKTFIEFMCQRELSNGQSFPSESGQKT
jgi:hypothetical protein